MTINKSQDSNWVSFHSKRNTLSNIYQRLSNRNKFSCTATINRPNKFIVMVLKFDANLFKYSPIIVNRVFMRPIISEALDTSHN